MSWLSDLKGTLLSKIGVGGPAGINIAHNSGVVEARNAADNAYANIRGARIPASATTIYDVPSLVDLKGRVATIEYSFAGVSPPSPGANTDKFGFCHTTSGGYTAGQVVYDTGAALLLIPTDVVKHLSTAVVVTGTISLINNGLYAYESSSWVLKGDGNATSEGTVRCLEISYTHNDTTKSSTTSIATGARIVRVSNDVTTAFSGGTGPWTLLAILDGAAIDTTILATADSDLTTAEVYVKDTITVVDGAAVEPGVVKITVSVPGAHAAGAGKLEVFYVAPNA